MKEEKTKGKRRKGKRRRRRRRIRHKTLSEVKGHGGRTNINDKREESKEDGSFIHGYTEDAYNTRIRNEKKEKGRQQSRRNGMSHQFSTSRERYRRPGPLFP